MSVARARTSLVNLEELSDEELERLHEEFRKLQELESRKNPSRRTAAGARFRWDTDAGP